MVTNVGACKILPNLRICEFSAIFKRSTFWLRFYLLYICEFGNICREQLSSKGMHNFARTVQCYHHRLSSHRQTAGWKWSERCSSQHWQQQKQQLVRLMCGNKGRPKESFLVLNVHEDRWIRRQWMRPLEAFLQYRERSKARSQTLSYYYGRYQNKAFGRQRNKKSKVYFVSGKNIYF